MGNEGRVDKIPRKGKKENTLPNAMKQNERIKETISCKTLSYLIDIVIFVRTQIIRRCLNVRVFLCVTDEWMYECEERMR